MSWLSSAIERNFGISKEKQRALTKPVGALLAPVTGGVSILVASAVNTAKGQAKSVIESAVDDARARIDGATAAVNAANAGANANAQFQQLISNPFVLVGGLVLIVLLFRGK